MTFTNDNSKQNYETSHLIERPLSSNFFSTNNICVVNEKNQVYDRITSKELSGQLTPDSTSDTTCPIVRSAECDSLPSRPEFSSSGSEDGGNIEQSTAQEYWWSLSQLPLKLPWAVMPHVIRLRGPLQLDALNKAISILERRHECLRTIFPSINGVGTKFVHPCQDRKLKITELLKFDENQLDLALQLERATDFDLETEPGWRVSLYRCDADDHILFITLHRIIDDIVSLNIIQKGLSSFYSAITRDQDPRSSAMPISVPDHDFTIVSENQCQLEYERQLEYWELHLAASRPAEILCDKIRPDVISGKTDVEHLTIQDDLLDRMNVFCASKQVALFDVLLGAFRAAHYRLTGSDDAVIGTTTANGHQNLEDVEDSFSRTKCIRIQVREEETFHNVVQQIHETCVEIKVLASQHVPFETVAARLQRDDSGLSRHPLAQILLDVRASVEESNEAFEGLEVDCLSVPAASAFDLELHFTIHNDIIRGQILFSIDLYEPETIKHMLKIFLKVLEQGLTKPNTALASLELFTADDYDVLDRMDLLKIPTTHYPRDSSVVDIFRKQVLSTPNTVAVKDNLAHLTYSQLDHDSDKIAQWLAYRRMSPETLVGVFAPRSCQVITAFFGILKSNLAYLPFDTTIPHGRMENILSSIPGNKIVLMGSDLKPPSVHGDVEFVHIADILELSPQGSEASRVPKAQEPPSPTSLAYVMFTSGSTGKPKGVMVEHRGIVRLVKASSMADYLPKNTVMAHLTSIGFDNSTWEIYAPLLNGGTLICIDPATVLDCTRLGNVFIREGVQSAMLTPALLKQYLIGNPDAIAALDILCVQGERADAEDMFLARKLSGGTAINAYGPTENSVTSTMFALPQTEPCVNGVPIGRALSNSGAYVMDANQQLVPLGIIGELVVTGDGLARGYMDTKQNENRFITITVSGKSIKAYRTGDYVRHRPLDGQLEFFGRIDGQVKIRGNRVELGEIEHVFRSHDCVADAVAVIKNEDQDARLVGFITLRDIRPGSTEESHLVETWLDHWDAETYTLMNKVQLEDIGRDFVGWTSTHDGSNIPRGEMNEWLDETIETILDGGHADSVFEIGSGSGMILFNLSKGLRSYVGIDPSGRAVDFVTKASQLLSAFANKVTVHKASAGDISRLGLSAPPDTAILNSVIQYFPSQDYLLRVIQSVVDVGAKRIFVGDVRSFALHSEFLAARALFIAGKSNMSKDEFRRIMADIEKAESELLIDPAFFMGLSNRLSRIGHVEILPKRVHATNELSSYRYAAVLYVNSHSQSQQIVVHETGDTKWIDFITHGLDFRSVQDLLQNSVSSRLVAISNVPNSKTILEKCILDALDDENEEDFQSESHWILVARQKAQRCSSMSAIDMVSLAQETGWRVELSWARQYSQRGGFDVIFHRNESENSDGSRIKFRFPADDQGRPYHSLSSQPLRRQLRQKVRDQLQSMLQARLPLYMVPQLITFLDKMPVNQSSKIDRKALVTGAQNQRMKSSKTEQPTSAREIQIQDIWSQVLGIDAMAIGRSDSFFSLGGDSIGAMRVVSDARKIGLKITVADVFRHPVLHDLASQSNHVPDHVHGDVHGDILPFAFLDDATETSSLLNDISSRYELDQTKIRDVYPCTPLQEGLMFETLKRPGDYMRQAVIELSPDISETRLRKAWEVVVRAKAILRTRIVQHNDLGLLQVVLDEPISWIDRTAAELKLYLQEDKSQSMDLGQPLARYALIRDELGLPKWLVWTAHHTLYDGWSLHLIQESVYHVYRSELAEIRPGPQFQAFIKYIKDQDQQEAKEYWRRVLHNCKCIPFPSLPPSVEHPIADTVIQHHLPHPKIKCRDITASTLVRAAWALVTGRMTNADDVIFGVTLYGRNAPVIGLDKMTAPTIATVPVRVHTTKDQTCSEYLQTVQREATEMIPYEQTGLQGIAKTSSSGQDACKFQTQLVIQPGDDTSPDCPLGKWQDGSEKSGFTTYALTLEIWLSSDGITAIAMFDSRAIKPWLVRRMLERLEWVMHQLAKASTTHPLSEVETSVPEDLEQIWNWNESVPALADTCVHELIEGKVRENPGAPAISAWDGELTYGRLDELSTLLASKLVDFGVAPDVLVPLCFEKSVWTIVSILGVLKAGGGFVLLDASLPESRLQGIVQQLKGNFILTSGRNKDLASRLADEVITVDPNFFTVLVERGGALIHNQKPSSSSTLYVIFTSGSTGTPKGVVISHGNLASALKHQVQLMGLTTESRLFDFASYSFDVSISNIFTTLASGGCLCVPKEEDRTNNLQQIISSMRVNALDLTPSVAQLLSPTGLPEVRSLTLGGEPLHPSDIQHWWEKKDVRIRNAYGPSECTPTSTINLEASTLEDATRIGRGAGVVTWIVDPFDHNVLLPVGCTGELLLEGPLVGSGYLNDPQKTEAAFIEDPNWLLKGASGRPGRHGRLYKTGDLVRYNEHGSLVFVSRKDEQIKIRGQRVELGEIEHLLRYQDYVDDAVAVLQNGDRKDGLIASFVTIRDIDSVAQNEIDNDKEAQQQIKSWEDQFDGDTYAAIDAVQPKTVGRDFIGWASMLDGLDFDNDDMNGWLDDTMRTIINCRTSLGHVLEIGTGSGMILFNLPDKMQSYVGLEPSLRAVGFTSRTAMSIPGLANKVKIFKATAADIPHVAINTQLSPNLVILNSVIQYFPSQEYLVKVIQHLIQLGSVETIFFGDVRSFALHKEFLAARFLHLESDASRDELRRMIANGERAEPELLVDPAFFTGLTNRFARQISHVEILPKIVKATNELTCYRYAAVVHIKPAQEDMEHHITEVNEGSWINFKARGFDTQSLFELLQSQSTSFPIAMSNIPYRKIRFERTIVDSLANPAGGDQDRSNWLRTLRQQADECESLSAIDLVELADRVGCKVEISWARQCSQRGGMDAIFHRCTSDTNGRLLFRFPTDHHDRDYRLLSSRPLRQQLETKIREKLDGRLRALLPSYMVPHTITILDRMPINKNGKVDRRMLAESNQAQPTDRGRKRQPATNVEKEMQRIWSQVLNMERELIGLDDGFIQLGGNSLGAMKVVTMARHFGIELSVADMFRHSMTSIELLLQGNSGNSNPGYDSSQQSATTDLMAEVARHDAIVASAQAQKANISCEDDIASPTTSNQMLTVLLTGANGFIGTQILRQLLENGNVCRVIAIVRGETPMKARQRTIEAAQRAQWWTEFHDDMLEVWSGDLSLPRLGLDPVNWVLLGDGKTVDIIIHNGASVHFMKSYAALEVANVVSTVEMLSITASIPRMKFVYVSSARHEDPAEEKEEDVAQDLLANSNGYSQTKFVAEALVKRAASRNTSRTNQFTVVSPGLVIGTPTEGVSNADDWLWRLAAACIRVGVYNGDNSDTWIPVSDAATTAATIIDAAMSRSHSLVTQVRGGIKLGDFWKTLVTAGYDLQAKNATECSAAIRKDIQESKESHPLWALSDMLDALEDTAKSMWATSWVKGGVSPVRLKVALQKSAEFLTKVGYLPSPIRASSALGGQGTTTGAFFRSGA